MVGFGVIRKRQVAIQQVRGAVGSLRTAPRYEGWCVAAAGPTGLLVLDVVTKESAHFDFMSPNHL